MTFFGAFGKLQGIELFILKLLKQVINTCKFCDELSVNHHRYNTFVSALDRNTLQSINITLVP